MNKEYIFYGTQEDDNTIRVKLGVVQEGSFILAIEKWAIQHGSKNWTNYCKDLHISGYSFDGAINITLIFGD
jgi:hypothetical protein